LLIVLIKKEVQKARLKICAQLRSRGIWPVSK